MYTFVSRHTEGFYDFKNKQKVYEVVSCDR